MQTDEQTSDSRTAERSREVAGVSAQTAILPWRQRRCPWCGSDRAECSTSSRYPTVVWVCGVCTIFEVAWGTVAWLDAETAREPERWQRVRAVMSRRVRHSSERQVITPDVLADVADRLVNP